MYGGELKRIQIRCEKDCLEAILDKLPTAEVIKKDKEKYIVQAEVFGDGVKLWINGQRNRMELI